MLVLTRGIDENLKYFKLLKLVKIFEMFSVNEENYQKTIKNFLVLKINHFGYK